MRYIIHIGLHKTGTTSIQAMLQDNIPMLRRNNFDLYQGLVYPENHVELHAASMRPQRESGFKIRTNLRVDWRYIQKVRANISAFVAQSPADQIIFTNEGLSLLRYPDELAHLKALFPEGEFLIIVYTRNPKDYLRSYAAQLAKSLGVSQSSTDKESFSYTASDSWLVDYSARIGAFEKAFGAGNVSVQDYDLAMDKDSDVIPSFLRTLGLEDPSGSEVTKKYFLNKTVQRLE